MLSRRLFLAGLAAAPGLRSQGVEARIDVVVDDPIGTIAPEIYGHFVEHLGAVVYDGIWVGEDSRVPNIGGIRKALVDALKPMRPGVIRWPGGCFADQYDWRDGAGARKARPKRTNFWAAAPEWPKSANRTGPQVYDPNHFGTIEFSRFCKLTGAEPYFAANLRSLPAQDYWRWVEYCNSPAGTTTLAEQRAVDGEREPLGVRYWGVGNESWGCGGGFAPEEYAIEYRRYSEWVPSYGVRVAQIASGPNGNDLNWTRKFFERARGALGRTWGFALHHYSWNLSSGRTTEWMAGKRDALKFSDEEYYELLKEGSRVEQLITSHWDAMGEFDRAHRVKVVVDEWGSWYAPGTEPFPEALLGQQNTMRDAVLAGISLDVFNRHADKVAMANSAQLVNCLQSLFFAHEDKFCVTPTGHVFQMYADHQKAQSVRTIVSAPAVRYTRAGAPASVAGLSCSASTQGKRLVLTVTNTDLKQPREVAIGVGRAATIASVAGTVLSAPDVHAHNTLQAPSQVAPKNVAGLKASGSSLTHAFPPASVTKLVIDLA
ncbi:MAG TPA: alpha-L-arabinofuranosidase C-terminal domain-containing protein [Bryobacteraceae bacterium]|nr:alpha-L-arabinofuranosidase C-terminal domain-containing protein [Bryobacteraceae bacterium]